jgi:hypothetical protein
MAVRLNVFVGPQIIESRDWLSRNILWAKTPNAGF